MNKHETSRWIFWENAMIRANLLALETGIRHQVRPSRDRYGFRLWAVSPVE